MARTFTLALALAELCLLVQASWIPAKAESAPGYMGEFNNIHVITNVESESMQNIDIAGWLDLRSGPLLLHIPSDGAANTRIQIADLHGTILERIAASEQRGSSANYLIVSRSWQGQIPAGVTRVIRPGTDLVQAWRCSWTELPQFIRFNPQKAGFTTR